MENIQERSYYNSCENEKEIADGLKRLHSQKKLIIYKQKQVYKRMESYKQLYISTWRHNKYFINEDTNGIRDENSTFGEVLDSDISSVFHVNSSRLSSNGETQKYSERTNIFGYQNESINGWQDKKKQYLSENENSWKIKDSSSIRRMYNEKLSIIVAEMEILKKENKLLWKKGLYGQKGRKYLLDEDNKKKLDDMNEEIETLQRKLNGNENIYKLNMCEKDEEINKLRMMAMDVSKKKDLDITGKQLVFENTLEKIIDELEENVSLLKEKNRKLEEKNDEFTIILDGRDEEIGLMTMELEMYKERCRGIENLLKEEISGMSEDIGFYIDEATNEVRLRRKNEMTDILFAEIESIEKAFNIVNRYNKELLKQVREHKKREEVLSLKNRELLIKLKIVEESRKTMDRERERYIRMRLKYSKILDEYVRNTKDNTAVMKNDKTIDINSLKIAEDVSMMQSGKKKKEIDGEMFSNISVSSGKDTVLLENSFISKSTLYTELQTYRKPRECFSCTTRDTDYIHNRCGTGVCKSCMINSRFHIKCPKCHIKIIEKPYSKPYKPYR